MRTKCKDCGHSLPKWCRACGIEERNTHKYIPNTYCVYGIRNMRTKKVYIGMTSNFVLRCKEHESMLSNNTHFNSLIQMEYNYYPEIAFRLIKKNLKFKKASKLERKLINKYYNRLYNIM